MASESYWKQVLLSLEQMTDEEFVEFVNENGGFEDEEKQFDSSFIIPIKASGMKIKGDKPFLLKNMVNSQVDILVSNDKAKQVTLEYPDSYSSIISDNDDTEAA